MSESTAPKTVSRRHPKAGTVMTGAEMIVQVLVDEGTTAVFGYSGGAILPTYDAVFLQASWPQVMPVPADESVFVW
jgi:acetolactate synthase-1/2/3 large subunit